MILLQNVEFYEHLILKLYWCEFKYSFSVYKHNIKEITNVCFLKKTF